MTFWNSFWDIIWWFLWIFIFTAYIMALFTIVVDLFRDRKLNGWWKAVWLIFLIFVPFITALVYLIARGRGMAERSDRSAAATEAAYRAAYAGTASDEITKAKALLDSGAITEAEFASIKSKALAG